MKVLLNEAKKKIAPVESPPKLSETFKPKVYEVVQSSRRVADAQLLN